MRHPLANGARLVEELRSSLFGEVRFGRVSRAARLSSGWLLLVAGTHLARSLAIYVHYESNPAGGPLERAVEEGHWLSEFARPAAQVETLVRLQFVLLVGLHVGGAKGAALEANNSSQIN